MTLQEHTECGCDCGESSSNIIMEVSRIFSILMFYFRPRGGAVLSLWKSHF